MEHLHFLDERFRDRFAAKVYRDIPYDGRGFWEFPHRLGWDDKTLYHGLLALGRTQVMFLNAITKDGRLWDPAIYAPLIQSWFYHGLLHEVLQVPVPLNDISQEVNGGERVLSTRHLEGSLRQWKDRMQERDVEEARRMIGEAFKCIRYVHQQIERISGRIKECTAEIRASPHLGNKLPPGADHRLVDLFFWFEHGRKVLPETLELSICILGYTLEYAARSIYLKLGLGCTKSSLPDLMWSIPAALDGVMVEQGHCRSQIARVAGPQFLIGACLACTVDHREQRDGHVACENKRCSLDDIKPGKYVRKHAKKDCDCNEVLDRDALSAVRKIVDGGGIPIIRVAQGTDLDIEVINARGSSQYVAISHVWADGRGNPDSNGLLRCQWLELQSLAHKSLDPDSNPESLPLQSLVPFWFDTFCVPMGKEAEIKELRVKAILKMAETYRSATTVLILDANLEALSSDSLFDLCTHLTFSKWIRRLWTMHEGAVGKSVKLQTAERAIDLRDMLKHNYNLVKRDASPGEQEIITGIGANESVATWEACLMVRRRPQEFLFMLAWNESMRRSTSQSQDRYLVLGILLNVKEETLRKLQRPRERKGGEDIEALKLKAILRGAPEIPSSIIFTAGPRFLDRSYGWAPTSMKYAIVYDHRPAGAFQEMGFLVSYPGWHLNEHPDWSHKFPSFTSDRSTCAFAVDLSGDFTDSFIVNVDEPDLDLGTVSASARLAVILQPLVQFSAHRAVLVEDLTPADKGSSVIHAKFLALLFCRSRKDESDEKFRKSVASMGKIQTIRGTWCAQGRDQQWCIG